MKENILSNAGFRRFCLRLISAVLLIFLPVRASATLYNRGTDSLGNQLIYDSDTNITWYDSTTSQDTWQNIYNWASALSVNINGRIYDDWKLPPISSISNPTRGMGHLYYTELGNPGYGPLANTGPFIHLYGEKYWENGYFIGGSHFYDFSSGYFDVDTGLQYAAGFAMRSGDVDVDGDGYSISQGDCDDNDAIEHPGQTWYKDADGDGYSDGTANTTSCTRPTGYKVSSELTTTSGDCNDGNSAINPSTYWYPDSDGDGYGNPSISLQQCLQPSGYVLDNTDSNDNDPHINPASPPVRGRLDDGSFAYYTGLQAAYDAQGDGFGMDVQEVLFNETLYFDRPIAVNVRGGYKGDFSQISGITILNGDMIISNGTVYIQNVILQ